MTTNTNKQTDLNLENQIEKLLCEKELTPTYTRIENSTPLNANLFTAMRENALMFNVKQQGQNEAEGITACYERLSQEDRNEGESNSIANQRKILESYCKSHSYDNVRHYDEDDGYSGTNFNRPGFQRMLADIKAGMINRVIVKDMSRLGRDYLQVGMYTDVVSPEYGVHFVAVNDGVDSTRGENEFTAIRNVFNEMFARDTSKKIKATWQNKGKSGERLTTNAPYGYVKDPNDKKKWLVDEEAAAVVQAIFNLCVEGKGPAQIARHLQEKRILNPTAYLMERGMAITNKPTSDPCKWSATVISRILERLEYLGHTVNFKTYKQSYKVDKKLYNDPDKWAIFENTHDAIIQESVFEIVQNLRKTRKRPTRQGEMGLFSGVLYCEDCGAKMYLCRASHFKPEQEYYICSNYRKDRKLCTTHSIRNVVLKEIVLQNLRKAIAYVSDNEGDFISEAAEISAKAHDKGLVTDKEALRKAEKRIDELDNIIKRLYEDNVTGKLTDERFMKLTRDYELEQENLKVSIEAMRHDVKQREQKRQNTKAFIAATKKFTDIKDLDGAILREFVSKINISALDRKSRARKIGIEYNFIGIFDFNAALEKTEAEQPQRKTA
jgi:DNA invertase Pin-like site-specific DNA recombinase